LSLTACPSDLSLANKKLRRIHSMGARSQKHSRREPARLLQKSEPYLHPSTASARAASGPVQP
jgi:hypothetical protein